MVKEIKRVSETNPIELADKDFLLIETLRDLTFQIKRLADKLK